MKLTSIGTVGRLGSPFVFNIPKAKLPQGGQRTVAGPYNCNRINPPYTNGMMGSVQEGAYDPFGSFDGDVGIFGGSSEAGFFEDFSWLENTDDSGGSGDEYTSAQAESVRESTPNQTIEFLKDFSKSSGITDATKNLVNVAVQRGVNEVKELLVPEDVGKRMIDPVTGKQGTIIKNPNNPNQFVIKYDDGTSAVYGEQQILVQGKSSSGGSNNNMLLIAGIVVAAAFLMK
jgi:hypothetical protein